jgi:hypothetical protein
VSARPFRLTALAAVAALLLALPAVAQHPALRPLSPVKCGRGHFPPCPPPLRLLAPLVTLTIAFDPPEPVIPDNTPAGSFIADIIVTVSDGTVFSGNLGFGAPYDSDGGFCAIQGRQLILGAPPPPGASVRACTITATQ